MSRIEIIFERQDFDVMVNRIYDAGVLQVEELTDLIENPELDLSPIKLTPAQQQEKETVDSVHNRIKSLLLLIPPGRVPDGGFPAQGELNIEELATRKIPELQALNDEVSALVALKHDIEEKLTVLEQYNLVFEAFAPLVADVEATDQQLVIGFTVEKKAWPTAQLRLEKELNKLASEEYLILPVEVSKELMGALLVINRKYAKETESLLAAANVHIVKMPSDLADLPFPNAVQQLLAQRDDLPKRLLEAETALAGISERNFESLKKLQMSIEDQLNLFKTIENFAQTGYTCTVRGWIPTRYLSSFQNSLAKAVNDRLIINELKVEEEDEDKTPVCVVHSPLLKPFEKLMSIFPLPKYSAIDPTIFLAVGFPLFFGAMLGDIGYGAILLGLAIYFKRKYRTKAIVQDVCYVTILCSISSVIFGVLYGELFGDFAHKSLGLKPLWEDRLKAIVPLLYFSVGVGVFHVFLGLILGIVESRREKALKHGLAKLATIMTIVGIFMLIAQLAQVLPKAFFGGGIVMLLVSLPLLVYADGIIGVLEIVSVIGNILSYARLLAIGLSSAIIAMVANYFGGAIGNVVAAAIVVLLLHAMNLVLGVYSPTIQGLRLHYVEFFKQFYRYGGRLYTPFARVNAATKSQP